VAPTLNVILAKEGKSSSIDVADSGSMPGRRPDVDLQSSRDRESSQVKARMRVAPVKRHRGYR
jgi:hypothetical protein